MLKSPDVRWQSQPHTMHLLSDSSAGERAPDKREAAGSIPARTTNDGESPSGKAAVFGTAIRRFESCLPNHETHGSKERALLKSPDVRWQSQSHTRQQGTRALPKSPGDRWQSQPHTMHLLSDSSAGERAPDKREAAGSIPARTTNDGESPSGKAAVFGTAIRRFESCLPNHETHGSKEHAPC